MPGVELVLVLHGYRGFGPLESGLHSPDNDGLKTLGDGMGLSGVLFFVWADARTTRRTDLVEAWFPFALPVRDLARM